MATTNLITKTIGDLVWQHGNGDPNHTAPMGSKYVNLDDGKHYENNNGATGWSESNPLSDADQTKLDNLVSLSNYVIIKQKSDFPTPSAGVITLVANTYYQINGSINLGTDRLVCAGDTKIEGLNAFTDQLIYTGTATALFNVTDFNVSISNITLVSTGTTSQVFNASNTGKTKNFILQNTVIASSVKTGTISGFDNVLLNIVNYISNATGWTLTNNNNLFLLAQNFGASNSGTYFSIPTGTFSTILIRNCIFNVSTTVTGLNIAATTITVTGNASLVGNSFLGVGTRTTGFTANNSSYVVRSNSGLSSFQAIASMVMTGNSTQTSNVSASTWTKIAGTTTLANNSRFTMPSNNRLTYTGAETINVKINVSLAAYYASGSSRIAEVGVYKNGSLITNSQNGFTIYSADEPCSTNIITTLSTNDYIEGWFQKFGGAGSDDYVFSYLNIQINEI